MTDPETFDAAHAVRDAWPTSGPWSPERTLAASEAAYEPSRCLNYATRRVALRIAICIVRLSPDG